jgi:hypothetical protein
VIAHFYRFSAEHPISSGWFVTLGLLSSEAVPTLHEADFLLAFGIRCMAFVIGVLTLSFSVRPLVADPCAESQTAGVGRSR